MLKHFLLHALGLAFAVLGFGIGEPMALGLQPDARANRQPALLGRIKDRPQTIRRPGADAVAARGHEFIEMLVARRPFDKVRLASSCDADSRHDLHRHSLRGSVSGGDDKDE